MERPIAIKAEAINLGFDKVGIALATLDALHDRALADWVRQGRAAGMDYMVRDWARRARPKRVLPGAKSIIALATNYFSEPNPPPQDRGPLGRIARYAYGRDYHKVVGVRLKKLVAWLQAEHPAAQFKATVDTGPVLERAFAAEAGLGFIGKNTTLITEEFGSWVFLSVILTDLPLQADPPSAIDCGSCALCLEACPTDALVEPFILDSRRCISYWTIESREPDIPREIACAIGDWVFGCDICQEVCPFNSPSPSFYKIPPHPPFSKGGRGDLSSRVTGTKEFHPSAGVGAWIPIERLLKKDLPLTDSPLRRAGVEGLARNARALIRRTFQNGSFPWESPTLVR